MDKLSIPRVKMLENQLKKKECVRFNLLVRDYSIKALNVDSYISTEIPVNLLRVAVFFFVFPISRSAHLWAPDEVKK